MQNVLTPEQFQQELIKRFFHPKSYFYRCIKNEIQTSQHSKERASNGEYQALDGLIEKIVASDAKIDLLESLQQVSGFDQFCERLEDGIRYLQENDLNCDKMKIEIENLSQSLIKDAVRALSDGTAQNQIKAFLNDEDVLDFASDFALPEQTDLDEEPTLADGFRVDDEFDFMGQAGEIDQQKSTVVERFDDVASQAKESLDHKRQRERTEPSVNGPEYEPPEIVADGSFDGDIGDQEKDFLAFTNGSKDASEQGGCEIEPIDEDGSVFSLVENNVPQIVSEEPLSLVSGFSRDIQQALHGLTPALDNLYENVGNAKSWRECGRIFDGIAAKAMVCGFEGFEQIAVKSKGFVTKALRRLDRLDVSTVQILSETRQALLSLVEGDIDHVDRKAVETLTKKLQSPKSSRRKPQRPSQPSAPISKAQYLTTPEVQKPPKPSRATPNESRVREASEPQPAAVVRPNLQPANQWKPEEPEPLEVPAEAQPDDFDISKFSLPGEDDDEIINLVNEISQNEEQVEVPFDDDDQPVFGEAFEVDVENPVAFETADAAEPEQFPQELVDFMEEAPQPAEPKQTETRPARNVSPDEKLSVYKEQAEFYFNIVEDSMSKLQSKPNDKISLEDLELASHSLFELAMKLNLDEISRVPEAIESLVRGVVSQDGTMSAQEYKVILDAYQYFGGLESVEGIHGSEVKRLIATIKKFASARRSQGSISGESDSDSFQIV